MVETCHSCLKTQSRSPKDRISIDDLSQTQERVFCSSCSTSILETNISRYKSAIETQNIERSEFEKRILATRLVHHSVAEEELSFRTTRSLPDPSHIQHQVVRLRQRLDRLRSVSNELAIGITSKTMENDQRQSQLETNYSKIHIASRDLDAIRQNLLFHSEPSQIEDTKSACSAHQVRNNVGGGLRAALISETKQIQHMRFSFALRVFEMHRIDVGEEYSNLTNDGEATTSNISKQIASGIGKIGGLPLPHAGSALYGVLPPAMLASSLRLVASLTNLLASCLGVVLPHPILLCSKECFRCGKVYNYGRDIIETTHNSKVDDDFDNSNLCRSCEKEDFKVTSHYRELHKQDIKKQSHVPSLLQNMTSKSPLLSFVGTSARKAVALATGSKISDWSITKSHSKSGASSPATLVNQNHSILSRNVPASVISRRVSYATFAVLLENHEDGAVEYILNPPRWKDEKKCLNDDISHPHMKMFSSREDFHAAEEAFATGLQLLQNDVIALCFRAGVSASMLWPAESMLLNLHSLLCYCVQVVDANR